MKLNRRELLKTLATLAATPLLSKLPKADCIDDTQTSHDVEKYVCQDASDWHCWHALLNDDMDMLRQMPLRMADAACRSLDQYVSEVMSGNPRVVEGNGRG